MMQFVVSMGSCLLHQWISRCLWIILGLILYVGFVSTPIAIATPQVTEVQVSLGNNANEMNYPNLLSLKLGFPTSQID
jgi:hypothetical protein